MAYEKQTWETGQVITAEKLNHMEDGIVDAGDVLVVTFTPNYDQSTVTVIMDIAFSELMTAYNNGKIIIGKMAYPGAAASQFSSDWGYDVDNQGNPLFNFNFTMFSGSEGTITGINQNNIQVQESGIVMNPINVTFS